VIRGLSFIFSLLVFLPSCFNQQSLAKEGANMPEVEDLQSIRPAFKEGDEWFIICAEEQQLPRRREELKEYPSAEDLDAMAKAREEALSKGRLPQVKLQSVGGHTLWHKYRFFVEKHKEGGAVFLAVTVTYVGYHGVPQSVLEEFHLKRIASPEKKLRYIFDKNGNLSKLEWYDKKEIISVNGNPVVLDWDFMEFPAGFPSFQVTIFDSNTNPQTEACSQVAKMSNGIATVWLAKNLADIHPPSSDPGAEFEVQKWRKSDQWWHEAYVVRDGDVTLLARMLE
jgi:hypothetical protein